MPLSALKTKFSALSLMADGVILLVCSCVTPLHAESEYVAASVAQGAIRPILARSMHIHYQISKTSQKDLDRVELWYNRGTERRWQLYDYDIDRRSPIEFTAYQEGRYQFLIVAVDRWGKRSVMQENDRENGSAKKTLVPPSEYPPHLTVFVDYKKPQLYLYSPREELDDYPHDHLVIRWSGYDAHLSLHPVTLFYRQENEKEWTTINGPLAAEGSFDWRIPDNVRGRIRVQAVLTDRVGHMDSQLSGWINVTSAHTDGGEPEAAISDPQSHSKIESSLPGLLVKRDPDNPFDRSPERVREIDRHFRRGIWFGRQREWDKAIRAFEKVLEIDPGAAEARVNKAIAHHRNGEFEHAIDQFQTVLQSHPKHMNALFNLAQTQSAMKQHDKSMATLDQLVALDKRDWQSWLMRGETARLQGNLDVAMNSWQYVVKTGNPYYRQKAKELLEEYQP